MIPHSLTANELALRKAIAGRQYREVPRLILRLRSAVDSHLETVQPTDPVRPEIAGWALALAEWARLMVTAQRQAWLNELETLPLVGRYVERPTVPARALCLDL
jgi:hypothetical protein